MDIKTIDIRANKSKSHLPVKTRAYIFIENEDIISNLTNRKQRPYTSYRKEIMPKVLEALKLPVDTKIKWSQYAGCTSCPCSPGFIIEGSYSQEVYVKI